MIAAVGSQDHVRSIMMYSPNPVRGKDRGFFLKFEVRGA